MAIDGINSSYVLPGQSVSPSKKTSTRDAFSFSNWLAQNNVAATIQKQSSAEKTQAASKDGIPAGFEDMAERVEQLKQDIEELMAQAREATGFTGKVCQGANDSLYGIGAYNIYDSETQTWQWYNEDGSMREGAPSEEESIEQARISAPKAQAHKQYLIDNGVYEIMDQLSREETILDCARQSEQFRSDYLADPEAALAKNSQMLGSRRSHFGVRDEGVSGNAVWYGAQPFPQLYSIPSETKRIDIEDVFRTAKQYVNTDLPSFANYSTKSANNGLQWWRK